MFPTRRLCTTSILVTLPLHLCFPRRSDYDPLLSISDGSDIDTVRDKASAAIGRCVAERIVPNQTDLSQSTSPPVSPPSIRSTTTGFPFYTNVLAYSRFASNHFRGRRNRPRHPALRRRLALHRSHSSNGDLVRISHWRKMMIRTAVCGSICPPMAFC